MSSVDCLWSGDLFSIINEGGLLKMFNGLQAVILFKELFFLLPIQIQVASFEMLSNISLALRGHSIKAQASSRS